MGKSLNIFRSYNISIDTFRDKEIQYNDNKDRIFTYTLVNEVNKAFEDQGIMIPTYDWLEPPEDGVLKLVNPNEVSEVLNIILGDCCEEMLEIFLMLKIFSERGYYLVWDNE